MEGESIILRWLDMQYSIALQDAIRGAKAKVIEVHLSTCMRGKTFAAIPISLPWRRA